MSLINLSLNVRRAVRVEAGASRSNIPVIVVDGASAPRETGESYYYETRGGKRIYHPSAYSRHGWSNMRYVPSSICVEVGRDWLIVNGLLADVAVAA